jgi:hypothetical protein
MVHISAAEAEPLLASVGDDRKMNLWDWRKGIKIAELDVLVGTVQALGWSYDDEWLMVCTKNKGHWNVRAWERRNHFKSMVFTWCDINQYEVLGGNIPLELSIGGENLRLWWHEMFKYIPGQTQPGFWVGSSDKYFEIFIQESRYLKY